MSFQEKIDGRSTTVITQKMVSFTKPTIVHFFPRRPQVDCMSENTSLCVRICGRVVNTRIPPRYRCYQNHRGTIFAFYRQILSNYYKTEPLTVRRPVRSGTCEVLAAPANATVSRARLSARLKGDSRSAVFIPQVSYKY